MPNLSKLNPVDRERAERMILARTHRIRNRMQVCIFPTPAGPCLATQDEIMSEGFHQHGGLVAMQEHLRAEHLGPAFQGNDHYTRFSLMLGGSSLHLGSDDNHRYLSGAYVYTLNNGQLWLFAGTSEQFDEWSRDHQEELTGPGNVEFKCALCGRDHFTVQHTAAVVQGVKS